jgi:hypothetical protein
MNESDLSDFLPAKPGHDEMSSSSSKSGQASPAVAPFFIAPESLGGSIDWGSIDWGSIDTWTQVGQITHPGDEISFHGEVAFGPDSIPQPSVEMRNKGDYPSEGRVRYKPRSIPSPARLNNQLCRSRKIATAPIFPCVFRFAGCASAFSSKIEWKQHVISQHVRLDYWICTEPSCMEGMTGGSVFDRKDLYALHVWRMHIPQVYRKALKSRKGVPGWDGQLRQMQRAALRHRCQLPTFLRCPALGCCIEFSGANAWDDRMEHVARHLEKVAVGDEPDLLSGEVGDPTVTNWAASPPIGIIRRAVGGGWELVASLTTSVSSTASTAATTTTETVMPNIAQKCIAAICKDIYYKAAHVVWTWDMPLITGDVTMLIKILASRLGSGTATAEQRGIMCFIYKHHRYDLRLLHWRCLTNRTTGRLPCSYRRCLFDGRRKTQVGSPGITQHPFRIGSPFGAQKWGGTSPKSISRMCCQRTSSRYSPARPTIGLWRVW